MDKRVIKVKENGFTMVELVIVIAVLGVLGTLLVPAYSHITTKAKLTSDITTVKTLKRTTDIYKAEQGTWPEATNFADLNSELKGKGYLEDEVTLQTNDASVKVDPTDRSIKLDLSGITDESEKSEVDSALDKIDDQTKTTWVIGVNKAE